MMTEVSSMIQPRKGVGTRYTQGYLDFLLLKKQVKYKLKKKERASENLTMIVDTEAFNNEIVRATPMPISLKEAYYEYRYLTNFRYDVVSAFLYLYIQQCIIYIFF